jgi:hypothetical protein
MINIMKDNDKRRINAKSAQNILATFLMIIGTSLVISTSLVFSGIAYVLGLCMIGAGIIISLYLIISRARMNKKAKKLSVLTKTAILCWAYIPLSIGLAMSTSLFGEGLQGLLSWGISFLFVGVAGMVLTIVELFRTPKD